MTRPDPLRPDRAPSHDGDLTELLDEQLLVERVRAGDPLAFEVIFRRYHRELCDIAAWVVGSRTGAQDVVQDLFLAVWAGRERWQVTSSVRAYLRRAARNMALRHSSRAAMRGHELLDGPAPYDGTPRPELADPGPSPEQQLEATAMEEVVARTAGKLPPRAREVYRLSRGEGLNTREIAQRLHISPKTVELHLTRALRALRAALGR